MMQERAWGKINKSEMVMRQGTGQRKKGQGPKSYWTRDKHAAIGKTSQNNRKEKGASARAQKNCPCDHYKTTKTKTQISPKN